MKLHVLHLKKLKKNKNLNIRVVSIPSFELFEKNNSDYKNQILGEKNLFGIEAGVVNGWEKYIEIKNFHWYVNIW